MKYSTANIKSSDYNEKHVIYVGTQTGTLKSKQMFIFILFVMIPTCATIYCFSRGRSVQRGQSV